jgi:hypothetical protein
MWVVGIAVIVLGLLIILEQWLHTARPKGRQPTLTITVETGERITLHDFKGTAEELQLINKAIRDIAERRERNYYGMLWGGLGAAIGSMAGLGLDGLLLISNLRSLKPGH